jgi:7-cyano-7-deazaguanine reductase
MFTAESLRAQQQLRFCSENRRILARASRQCQSRPVAETAILLEFFTMSSSALETFPNPRPERDYEIAIQCPEFTSVCPMTGLPDFGEIRITYVPDARCVELKSLKYYLTGFRNRGIFYENATNQILDDLVTALQPRRMTVVGDFSVRGGIKTLVTATYAAV